MTICVGFLPHFEIPAGMQNARRDAGWINGRGYFLVHESSLLESRSTGNRG
jgi:hypothetical protein